MSGQKVLVTGATGFIGSRLVRRLISRGDDVTCLARKSSNLSELEKLNCSIVFADVVEEPSALPAAIANVDTVYHLAALTCAIRSRDLVRINTTGTRNVLKACANQNCPPTIVFVSSLAAVGTSSTSCPSVESDPRQPVSFYGRSKAACELIAMEYAGQLSISIVRPPIVLGDGDRTGFKLFQTIDKLGWHLTPGLADHVYSVIHVDDLVTDLIGVADRGKRLAQDSEAQGIYFASSDETFTFSALGTLIGQALGRKRTRILRCPLPLTWMFAAVSEVTSRLRSRPQFVSMDKLREARAGSWVCSNARLKAEVGVAPTPTMLQRMEQTAAWYRQQGWLKAERTDRSHAPTAAA